MKFEILYNNKIKQYTLQKEIDGVVSVKKKPIKYKQDDSTARFRKELLKQDLS